MNNPPPFEGTPPVEHSIRALRRRSWLALGAVACLLLLNQLLVQPPLLRLLTDAPVINLAGRQRMLSQRLVKAALAGKDAGIAERRRRRAELGEVLALWVRCQDGLRHGDPALALPGRNSTEINRALDDLEPSFRRMRAAAARLVQDPAGARSDLEVLLDKEPDYLVRMDRIVGMYEREARGRIARLRRTGWAVTGLIVAALIGLGGVVLRPAVGLIQRQMAELRAAHAELEARVRERTRELEREVRERSLVEHRHRTLLDQFSHVARTNTIGEMASSLAHELNQPLGAIANYAEGCRAALEAPEPPIDEVRDAQERILATALRAGQIIQRIRRFVTRREPVHEPFEPNPLVAEVLALFEDELRRRGIAVEVRLAPDLPLLRGDPVQIQQVLVNLVRNAIEAMASSERPAPTLVVETGRAGSGAVEFRITDNGEGVPPDQKDRVFDAFFSTRAEGMGLGLAISRTIVEAHQGRLAVESEPGVQTTFRFTIPSAGGER